MQTRRPGLAATSQELRQAWQCRVARHYFILSYFGKKKSEKVVRYRRLRTITVTRGFEARKDKVNPAIDLLNLSLLLSRQRRRRLGGLALFLLNP